MVRFAYIIAVIALLGQASGIFAATSADESRCKQPCPDDDDEGHCPPNCAFCACCAHMPTVTVVRASVLLKVPPTPVLFHVVEVIPPSAEPADILHVPKPLLA